MQFKNHQVFADSDFGFADDEILEELPKPLELPIKVYQIRGAEFVRISDLEKSSQQLGITIKRL